MCLIIQNGKRVIFSIITPHEREQQSSRGTRDTHPTDTYVEKGHAQSNAEICHLITPMNGTSCCLWMRRHTGLNFTDFTPIRSHYHPYVGPENFVSNPGIQ